ncbi:MAG TPA: ClpX C4-type zinc finger protein [Acetobacteraceae bacterium]|nr:ClpX C4-type zinc finger protein [Acetobacteraceae bacterium]
MATRLHCSFCGKSEQQVDKLAAGPGGIHICNECVGTCQVIMAGDGAGPARDFDPATWPTERLLALLAPVNATVEAHSAHLSGIVGTLRSRQVSWAKIAEPLGVSHQSAWERFG